MITIYKFTLTGRHSTPVELPKDSIVLHCDIQSGELCVWVRVDTDKPKEKRYFTVVGTGWELDENMCYIGTVQEPPYVWHIMEVV